MGYIKGFWVLYKELRGNDCKLRALRRFALFCPSHRSCSRLPVLAKSNVPNRSVLTSQNPPSKASWKA